MMIRRRNGRGRESLEEERFVQNAMSWRSQVATSAAQSPIPIASAEIERRRGVAVKSPRWSRVEPFTVEECALHRSDRDPIVG
jgi:hypothetical protein